MQPVDWYFGSPVAGYSPTLIPTTNERYCDLRKFDLLNIMKANYDVKEYEAARNATNPYESLGKLGYINRAAVKLAEIDAEYLIPAQQSNVIANPGTLRVNSASNSPATFVDIAGGPGGFTQYLQHKYPKIIGYGITLPGDLTWRMDKLDGTRFVALTGDLYTDWSLFRDEVLRQQPQGVDLAVADGGFEVEITEQWTDVQEAESTRLLIIEASLGLLLTKVGGNFVLKVFGTSSPIMADLLYILSLGFEKIGLVKPKTSRPANSERYLLCMNRRNNNIDLSAVSEADVAGMRFNIELPPDYVQWIIRHNDLSLDLRLRSAKAIFEFLACRDVEAVPVDFEPLLELKLK